MPEITVEVISGRAMVSRKGWQTVTVSPQLWSQVRVLRFSPVESLWVSDALPDLCARLKAEGLTTVDVSCAFRVVRIVGPAVRQLLAKGCGLDLDRDLFPTGSCTRTRFAQIPVVVDCKDSTQFELYIGRSYLKFLQSWVLDALSGL